MTTAGMSAGLSGVSNDDLVRLLASIATGHLVPPFGLVALTHAGYGHLREALTPYAALPPAALSLVIEAVLAERRSRTHSRLDLVWSGTDRGPSLARYTKVVVPDLFSRAARFVTLAGYSFDHGERMFEPLHRTMRERNVVSRFFVDIHQLHERLKQALRNERRKSRLEPLDRARADSPRAYAEAVLDLFVEHFWPFEGPRPEIYYDPRTADDQSFASLHAKCIVVDHEQTLITSANFTDRGQTRNIEVGVLIRDPLFAQSLEQQWFNLVSAGAVERWGL
ncbi:MAG: phospholipase D-like domain-containing protein [Myxococcota bacterium]|nr:phospholipase D-like domain-containing protein [Myxococcota bacterium]